MNQTLKATLNILALFAGYTISVFLTGMWYAEPITVFLPFEITKRDFPVFPYKVGIALLIGFASGISLALMNPYRTSGKEKKRYGNAHFASKREIKKMALFAKKGMILGTAFGDYVRTNQCLSAICLAPPLSGKSATWIIPNLLSIGGSVICYDVKGTLFKETSLFRSSFSKTIVFNPTSEDCPSFNMLASNVLPENWFDQVREVGMISRSLYPDPPIGRESHWIENARRIFRLFALIHIHTAGGTSIPEARRSAIKSMGFKGEELTDDTGKGIGNSLTGMKAFLAAFLDEQGEDIPAIIEEEAQSLLGVPDSEFGSVISTFTTGVEAFLDDRCAAAFSGQSDIIPRDLKKEKTTIYIKVTDKDSQVLQRPLRVFFEASASQLMEEELKKREEIVTLVIDEFPRLGKMDIIMKAPALQRSYGMRTMFSAQSITQIAEIYGKSTGEEIMQTTAYKIIYAQNNHTECKAISESCGKKTETKRNRSRNKDGWSPSESSEGVPLILPQEIGSLPLGHAIIQVQRFMETPIKAIMPYYEEIDAFKKRVGCISPELIKASHDNSSDDDLEEVGMQQY